MWDSSFPWCYFSVSWQTSNKLGCVYLHMQSKGESILRDVLSFLWYTRITERERESKYGLDVHTVLILYRLFKTMQKWLIVFMSNRIFLSLVLATSSDISPFHLRNHLDLLCILESSSSHIVLCTSAQSCLVCVRVCFQCVKQLMFSYVLESHSSLQGGLWALTCKVTCPILTKGGSPKQAASLA